jgi:hypothetical protein
MPVPVLIMTVPVFVMIVAAFTGLRRKGISGILAVMRKQKGS